MVRFLQRIPLLPKLLLKALLIMLMPLNFTITNIYDLLYLPFGGLLFTSWQSYGYIVFESAMYIPSLSFNEISSNFAIGLLLAAPAIYFNYRIVTSPADNPLRNFALGIMVFSGFVTFLALMIISSTGSIYYINYMLMQNIQIFPTLAVCFFIILPMIQRQAILIAAPEELHSSTVRELERHPHLEVRREKALASLLWACLCFLPFFMLTSSYSYYYEYTSFYSFAYLLNSGYTYYDFFEYFATSGMAVPFFSLPVLGILSSIRFVYVRDIYRYLKHEIAYRRLLYIGIFSDIFPVISFTFINMIVSPGMLSFYNVLPIPILFFVGLLMARIHKSVLPYANRIWEDVDARMWFEDQVEQPPKLQEPERPYRPAEETIRVPIRYMITSQIRKRFRNNRSENSHED
jgi:hypothetical protein